MTDTPPIRRNRPTFTDQEALQFHAQGRPGKLEVVPTKPMATQRDLSLAYSPGVAVPVLAIAADPSLAFDYTTAVQHGGGDQQRYGDPRARQSRGAGVQTRDGRQGGSVQAFRRRGFHRSRGRHGRPGRLHQFAFAISARPSAASISRTSRPPNASSSRNACANSWIFRSSMTISTAPRSSPRRASSTRCT